MDSRENEPTEIHVIADIELRLLQGEDVSLEEQLQLFRFREKTFSQRLTDGDESARDPLDFTREHIKQLYTDLGKSYGPGIGGVGQSSRRDAHNTSDR